MLCTVCGKNQATLFFKRISDKHTARGTCDAYDAYDRKQSLCSICAERLGAVPFPFSILCPSRPDAQAHSESSESRPSSSAILRAAPSCPQCGTTAEKLLHTGKVGCAQCYNVFRELLAPVLTIAYHGHFPSVPNTSTTDSADDNARIDKLFRQNDRNEWYLEMERAVEQQDYERAALYRDKIRAFEKSLDKNDAERSTRS